jgi:hypothetical protein
MCSTNIHLEVPNKTTIDLRYLVAKQKFESCSSKTTGPQILMDVLKILQHLRFWEMSFCLEWAMEFITRSITLFCISTNLQNIPFLVKMYLLNLCSS